VAHGGVTALESRDSEEEERLRERLCDDCICVHKRLQPAGPRCPAQGGQHKGKKKKKGGVWSLLSGMFSTHQPKAWAFWTLEAAWCAWVATGCVLSVCSVCPLCVAFSSV